MESQVSSYKKRLTGFNDNWKNNPDFKDWIEKKDDLTAVCKICNSDIMVKYEGRRALTVSIFTFFPYYPCFVKGNHIYCESKITMLLVRLFIYHCLI